MTSARRAAAALFSTALCASVLWPLAWAPGRDGFPLSTYPMFASEVQPEYEVDQVLAVGSDGARRPVPPELTGNGTVLQAFAAVAGAVQGGRAAELCAEVAARYVAGAADEAEPPVALEVAHSRFDVLSYFRGHPEPLSRHVLARCEVAPR